MAYSTAIHESIRGRNLGFEFISSGKHGSTQAGRFIVGAESYREHHSSAETTGTNLKAYGHSVLTTVGSSAVFILDPPIPGVEKTVTFHTTLTNPIYLKASSSSVNFLSSQGTTAFPVLVSSQGIYATLRLMALSTGAWAILGGVSTAVIRAAATT